MKERKPSQPMLVMLYHLSNGKPWYAHLRGRSEHGGGERTLKALKTRGYIDNVSAANVTQLGQRMLNKYGPHLLGFAEPKAEGQAVPYDPTAPAVVATRQEDGGLKVTIAEQRIVEEKRVRELLESMREDGEYDRYFEIRGEDAKLLYTWLKKRLGDAFHG